MAKRNEFRLLIKAIKESNARGIQKTLRKLLGEKVREKLNEKEKEISQSLFKESIALNEDVVDTLKDILKTKSKKPIKFQDGTKLSVDLITANALVTIFNALKQPSAQEKFRRMANKNSSEFLKLVDFAWSKTKR